MAHRKKTVKIADVLTKANQYIKESPQDQRVGRRMLASFVEGLLMDSNNYKGFRYLRAGELKPDELPGIIFDESEAQAHVYPDDSRVAYY